MEGPPGKLEGDEEAVLEGRPRVPLQTGASVTAAELGVFGELHLPALGCGVMGWGRRASHAKIGGK